MIELREKEGGQGDFFRGFPEEPYVLRKIGASPLLLPSDDCNAGVGESDWIPRYERMVIAGGQVRLSRFEKPYYTGGVRESKNKLLGRASVEVSEEDKELNRKKNARRREQKLGDLIRCNTKIWKKSEETQYCNKFVTLTLKQNVPDISDATPFLKGFFARITRVIRKVNPDFKLKHIWVTEFQDLSRGVVHFHILCNLPYIKQQPVIVRSRVVNGEKEYEYLHKKGYWTAVIDSGTRVFESFYHAKKFIKSLPDASLLGYEIKVKKVLFDLAKAWGKGFVGIKIVNSAKKAKAYASKLIQYLTKASDDCRFHGKRIFDYSRGSLDKPVVMVSSTRINEYIEEHELWLALEGEFYFECFLGETELYIFDLFLLDDTTFNPPPSPPW